MIPPKPEPPENRTVREGFRVNLLAVLFFPAMLGAFVVGVAVGEERGGAAADQQLMDQAQAAFDSCATAYGELAARIRGGQAGK